MGLKEIFSKALHKDPRLKEMEQEMRMQKMLEDRMKGADERELDRFYEEERQKTIKKNLEEFRNMRKKEAWSGEGNNILKQKNIFKNHKSVLHQDFEILGGKKLFMGKGNMMQKGNMMNGSKIKQGGGW